MTRPKRRRTPDERQRSFVELFHPAASLIEVPEPAPVARGDAWLREALVEAIRVSGLDRETVAERLSDRLQRRVTKAMVDAWCGLSKPHQLPAAIVHDVCGVLGNTVLLAAQAQAAGCRLVESYELQLARLGQIVLFKHMADAEVRQIVGSLPLFRGAPHA